MDKTDKIWNLKDQLWKLGDQKSSVQWALADDREDLAELKSKIATLENRYAELENLNPDYDWGGPIHYGGPLKDQKASAIRKRNTAVEEKNRLLQAGPHADKWEESERLSDIKDLTSKIATLNEKITDLEADIKEEAAAKAKRKKDRKDEMTTIEGKLYRLRSSRTSQETLIKRREARIKSIETKIKGVKEKLRKLGA